MISVSSFLFMILTLSTSREYFNLTILYSSDIFAQIYNNINNSEGNSSINTGVLLRLTDLKIKPESERIQPMIYVNPGNVLSKPKLKSWKWYMEQVNSLPITASGLSWFQDSPSFDAMEPLLKLANHPILACNLNVKNLAIQRYIKSSTVLKMFDRKVGIVGYISRVKRDLYPSDDDLGFAEEALSISRECSKLRASGVQVIIGLGFSDFVTDLRIAESVECVDVVIGSDSEVFSWRNEPIEVFENRNPVMVQNIKSKKIPVTQKHDDCVGEIHLEFDGNGKLLWVNRFRGTAGKDYDPLIKLSASKGEGNDGKMTLGYFVVVSSLWLT